MNRFADIARILADRAAIHRLQIILRKTISDERRTQLTLTSGDTTLTSSFSVEAGAVTGIPRSIGMQGEGLAFDHAQIITDAWLLLAHRK